MALMALPQLWMRQLSARENAKEFVRFILQLSKCPDIIIWCIATCLRQMKILIVRNTLSSAYLILHWCSLCKYEADAGSGRALGLQPQFDLLQVQKWVRTPPLYRLMVLRRPDCPRRHALQLRRLLKGLRSRARAMKKTLAPLLQVDQRGYPPFPPFFSVSQDTRKLRAIIEIMLP